MKKQIVFRGIIALTAALCAATVVTGQKLKPKPPTQKPIIFAVLNDGTTLEPIAFVGKKLTAPVNGSDNQAKIAAFDKLYYRAGTTYRMIFGGANAGTVDVKNFDPQAECSRNMANVAVRGNEAPLKGLVMALATNAASKSSATGYRRKATAAEQVEMDALAKAEFIKQKLTPKTLHYQNLTALDVNNDGQPEFVASYWIEIDKLTRGLLFFIAHRLTSGKYSVGYRGYRAVDQSSLMSGAEIKMIDEGTLHELLLDSFDYDGDGTNEIFTYTQSFEGAGFDVYRRSGGKWIKAYEFANYHCAY
jgi:hypothetical protein